MKPQTPQVVAQASPASMGGLDEQVYSRLLRERIIFLAGQVEDNMANAICAQILLLAAEDTEKDIYLYINSPGGSITAGMAIYDTMQFVKNDVATVAMGMAASMGQFLLTAGAPGKRYALPNARILMHQPLGGIGGTATDIRIQAEQMAATRRWQNSLLITLVKALKKLLQIQIVTAGLQQRKPRNMALWIRLHNQKVKFPAMQERLNNE
jgi:ATP-dependent Clp protease protease subunit